MNHFTIFLSVAALVGSAAASLAQTTSPYAGQEQRSIKALSDREISDLTEGRGMGLAKAAELNGYPGPMHVLELADPLELSDQQRVKMQELFAAMKAEAIPLGERLIAQEADLDKQFAGKTITPASLAASTEAIGTADASQIPFVHARGADARAGSALRRTSRL